MKNYYKFTKQWIDGSYKKLRCDCCGCDHSENNVFNLCSNCLSNKNESDEFHNSIEPCNYDY